MVNCVTYSYLVKKMRLGTAGTLIFYQTEEEEYLNMNPDVAARRLSLQS